MIQWANHPHPLVLLMCKLIVASYIYQDGEAFVRASMAMDAIVQALIDRRDVPPGKVSASTHPPYRLRLLH